MQFEQLYRNVLSENIGDVIKVGVFPGAFKPPHVGHYTTALNACKDNDKIYIYISSKPRELSTQNKSSGGDDSARYSSMFKNDKYTDKLLSVQAAEVARMTSASAMRTAITLKDKNTVYKNLPDSVDRDAIYNILMQSIDISNDNYGMISAAQTVEIWQHYKRALMSQTNKSDQDIVINVSDVTPVRDTYELVDTLNNSQNASKISVRLYVGT